MKIFASNFTDRLTTGAFIGKMQKLGQRRAMEGSRDLLLEFLDPLHISGTIRNFKFRKTIDHEGR